MPAQNYEVQVYLFGEWPRGTVLPEFAVLWAGGKIDEYVERGVVVPTRKPVPEAVTARLREMAGVRAAAAKASGQAQKAADDVTAAELEALRTRCASLEEAVETAQKLADDIEAKRLGLVAELADYVDKNRHLEVACEEHQKAVDRLAQENAAVKAEAAGLAKKVAELTADLEAATAPDKAGATAGG